MHIELELLFNNVVIDEIHAHDAEEAAEILNQHSRDFNDQNEELKRFWLFDMMGQPNPVVTIRKREAKQ